MSNPRTRTLRTTVTSVVAAATLSTGLAIAYQANSTAASAHDHTSHSVVATTDHPLAADHPATTDPAMTMAHTATKQSTTVQLYRTMRTLWDQHMQWTYDTIVAFATDAPNLQAALNRLLRNQTDLGNAIKPFYGKKAGKQLTSLLKVHINDAVPVLAAAKAGDQEALATAVKEWYRNARDLGDFLAAANPAWSKKDSRSMMKTHITQTIGYATDVLTGKYRKAIKSYDDAQRHMDEMADMLSAGIIAQFPNRF